MASVGVGIFFGAVFLGLIYLYVNTRDRWNWSRIVKRTLVALAVLIALPIIIGLGYLGYEEWGKRAQLVTSLEGISIGAKLADVTFKHGNFDKAERSKDSARKYEDEVIYAHRDKRVGITIHNGTVNHVAYHCKTDGMDYTVVNQIRCNDSGDEIIQKFSGKVRVLCEKSPKEGLIPARAFDVVEYGTRYYLDQNRVQSLAIFEKHELQSLVGLNWIPCK